MSGAVSISNRGQIDRAMRTQVIKRVNALLKKHGLSKKQFCRQLGSNPSPSVISQILNNKYNHEDEKYIRQMNSWLEQTERRNLELQPGGICETTVVNAVRAGCDRIKARGGMALLYGPSGIGKTVAAKEYCRSDLNAVYIRLQSTHLSPTTFLRQVAHAVRTAVDYSAARTMEGIQERLTNSHRLLVIDEWHQAGKHISECVRDLHDGSGVPIALIGTQLTERFVAETRAQRGMVWSDQFCSRIKLTVDLTDPNNKGDDADDLFTLEDIRTMFKADAVRLDRTGATRLQQLACDFGAGCLRTAQNSFELAVSMARRNGGVITQDTIDSALEVCQGKSGVARIPSLKEADEASQRQAQGA